MLDGVEMQKATVAAGNRCYYLKVSPFQLCYKLSSLEIMVKEEIRTTLN